MNLQWMDSSGGPLICSVRAAAKLWLGVNGSSTSSKESDYERACQTINYLSAIQCACESVLVLGDEPLQSAFMQSPNGLVIVRWVSSLSQELTVEALRTLPASLPRIEQSVPFTISDARLTMFDSASDGAEVSLSVEVDAPIGQALVTTEKYSSPGQFEFLIHRFLRA